MEVWFYLAWPVLGPLVGMVLGLAVIRWWFRPRETPEPLARPDYGQLAVDKLREKDDPQASALADEIERGQQERKGEE